MESTAFEYVQAGGAQLAEWAVRIPGSQVVWRYLVASHRNDPIRTLLELGLVFFILRTYAQSRTKGGPGGKSFVKFSDKVRSPQNPLFARRATAQQDRSRRTKRSLTPSRSFVGN